MINVRSGFVGAALLAAAAHASAGNVDAKLLDMLLANGSITQAQHDELLTDLKREERKQARADRQKVDREEFNAYRQVAGWAANTRLTGDMRVRNDYINIEDEPKYNTTGPGEKDPSGRDKDRQRIRARLAAITQVNPQVEAGIQIATGNSSDRRSTNQDLDNYFDKKAVWLDLGYIDYHPLQVPGLKLFAGKMKQPWMSLGDVAWDGDINPEGFAASYQRKSGTTTFFGSGGYFVMKDNVDGDGVERDNDLGLYSLQAGVAFDPSASLRWTLGASAYLFNNDGQPNAANNPKLTMIANGNTTDEFALYEGFSQLDVIGLPLPLSLYGQYVRNADAQDYLTFTDGDEDTAWLLGLRTNVMGVALDYNYRDVERNAVVGYFTDSDFASGYTASSGHKIKASYDFLKNFNLTVSYFLTESDAASRYKLEGADADTVMIDLNAKF